MQTEVLRNARPLGTLAKHKDQPNTLMIWLPCGSFGGFVDHVAFLATV
jgi:hypothetical protein